MLPALPIERIEPALPTLKTDPTLPMLRTLPKLAMLPTLGKLKMLDGLPPPDEPPAETPVPASDGVRFGPVRAALPVLNLPGR